MVRGFLLTMILATLSVGSVWAVRAYTSASTQPPLTTYEVVIRRYDGKIDKFPFESLTPIQLRFGRDAIFVNNVSTQWEDGDIRHVDFIPIPLEQGDKFVAINDPTKALLPLEDAVVLPVEPNDLLSPPPDEVNQPLPDGSVAPLALPGEEVLH